MFIVLTIENPEKKRDLRLVMGRDLEMKNLILRPRDVPSNMKYESRNFSGLET